MRLISARRSVSWPMVWAWAVSAITARLGCSAIANCFALDSSRVPTMSDSGLPACSVGSGMPVECPRSPIAAASLVVA